MSTFWPSLSDTEYNTFKGYLDDYHSKRIQIYELREQLVDEFVGKLGGGRVGFFCSATRAFELLLEKIGLCALDEVILPINVFYSIYLAVEKKGCQIILVDTMTSSQLPCTKSILERVSDRTKLIVFPHMGGEYADVLPLLSGIDSSVYVVRDLCQSYPFNEYDSLKMHSRLYNLFSFSGTKLLSAGEGGGLHSYSGSGPFMDYESRKSGMENYEHSKSDRLSYLQEILLLTRLVGGIQVMKERSRFIDEYLRPIKHHRGDLFVKDSNRAFDSNYSYVFTLNCASDYHEAQHLLDSEGVGYLEASLFDMSILKKVGVDGKFKNFVEYSTRSFVNSISSGCIEGKR
ncbi:DegT/DnrJ/EryC1/StrS family aminotransferase [Gilvimarinus sp. SDUM040013]|uniref:DegT/DnrJ/EryC1/StrS family aminotransferase n=1 Tax=Gilvimarinus gilvus TaxID=3058038 RepID=A0ABU4S256_9GAMM|nr:DegT/DnrJ/EryC1/StrS family aminotransferase [Gilvimarinus sp. SDUM040013]MDO3386012.1 DegT/DnrJ/EryC1/StrS family aminotransferase [Gilvimarinus sp. SDUM040013]MDX6850466.1 DegT/DnrJ/EryC1/StrS family aminotransferase [Gilvimarinus sp. SDUM040013]